jgi:hypothetical protein
LARAQEAGRVRADAEIDDLVRLVNAIALATEDAPDRVALADHQFALMMDGVYAPASTRPRARNCSTGVTPCGWRRRPGPS